MIAGAADRLNAAMVLLQCTGSNLEKQQRLHKCIMGVQYELHGEVSKFS